MNPRALMVAAGLALLAGCTETPQDASGVKSDAPVYSGTGMPYSLTDWKQGDRDSWEKQLRVRGQGQNEYVRINN